MRDTANMTNRRYYRDRFGKMWVSYDTAPLYCTPSRRARFMLPTGTAYGHATFAVSYTDGVRKVVGPGYVGRYGVTT